MLTRRACVFTSGGSRGEGGRAGGGEEEEEAYGAALRRYLYELDPEIRNTVPQDKA